MYQKNPARKTPKKQPYGDLDLSMSLNRIDLLKIVKFVCKVLQREYPKEKPSLCRSTSFLT